MDRFFYFLQFEIVIVFVIIDEGKLFAAGSNKYGQLGLNQLSTSTFELVPLHEQCIMAACGQNHSLILCQASSTARLNTVLVCGQNNFQQCGYIGGALNRSPIMLSKFSANHIRVLNIFAGGDQV